MYTIYMHMNKINGKVYIGKTSQDPNKRFGENLSNYLKKKPSGKFQHPVFARALLKYGAENFISMILYTGLTAEQAIMFEEDLIKKYKGKSYNASESSTGFTSESASAIWLDEDLKKYASDRMRESYVGNSIAHDRAIKNHKENQANITAGIIKSCGKKVKCKETEKVYETLTFYLEWLSSKTGSTAKLLGKHAKRQAGKKWRGFTFEYLDE